MITEEQLLVWSQAPSPTEMAKIQKTKDEIIDVLKKYLNCEEIKRDYNLLEFPFPKIYLQGSYANSTNVRFSSDVDIVVEAQNPFFRDISNLSSDEKISYHKHFSNSEYKFFQFRKDVFVALQKEFGNLVEPANKCLKIKGNQNRCDADIVVCFQHRKYFRFISPNESDHNKVCGIEFITKNDKKRIVNYPKLHLENCTKKHQNTNEKFKKLVRIFKNMNLKMIENSPENFYMQTAPSYYIENLIYNCPNHHFESVFTDSVNSILNFLLIEKERARLSGFRCANEIDGLFDDGKWDIENAESFITLISDFYEN